MVIVLASVTCDRLSVLVKNTEMPCKSLKLELLFRVHEVVVAEVGKLNLEVAVVAEAQTSGFRLLCLHHHNAVGSLGTIESGRSGILQDGDALDTIHTEV